MIMVLIQTDLPDPDSPTIANVSPSIKSTETFLIAVKVRSRTLNLTTISRALRIAFFDCLAKEASKINLFFLHILPPTYVSLDQQHRLKSDQRYKVKQK